MKTLREPTLLLRGGHVINPAANIDGSLYGVDPRAALRGGVTTAVDAGTCGCVNFAEFRRTAIDGAAVRILPFIHIGCLGIPTPTLGELQPASTWWWRC